MGPEPSSDSASGSSSNPASNSENASTSGYRKDYISWHDYFMGVAFLAAMRSKDPNTQVGACIVNADSPPKIVGIGYNGFAVGCSDKDFSWRKKSKDQSKDSLEDKSWYVCHAEMNAIVNKNCCNLQGCTMYVGLFPCNECAKLIIQSGIKHVYYMSDCKAGKNDMIASKRMLKAARVTYQQYIKEDQEKTTITIDFKVIDKAAAAAAKAAEEEAEAEEEAAAANSAGNKRQKTNEN